MLPLGILYASTTNTRHEQEEQDGEATDPRPIPRPPDDARTGPAIDAREGERAVSVRAPRCTAVGRDGRCTGDERHIGPGARMHYDVAGCDRRAEGHPHHDAGVNIFRPQLNARA